MTARCPAELPPELLVEILSRLSCRQLLIARRVSGCWRAAAETALTRCQELDITRADFLRGLDAEMLESLLQKMPSLKRLSVDGRSPGGGLLHVDLVSRHCRRLEELRLVSFLVDASFVGQLCESCPRLRVVSLRCSLDEVSVETLLRRLPGVRSLHLAGTRAVGDCLSLLPAELRTLTLPDAIHIQPVHFSNLTRCTQLRELDLSRTKVRSDDLAGVLAACPLLERLAVLFCLELDLTPAWVQRLSDRPQLQELRISHLTGGVRYQSALSDVLATCTRVQRLALTGLRHPHRYLTAENLPSLTHLDLSDSSVRNATLRQLPDRLPALRHLRLFNCRQLRSVQDGAMATALHQFRSLEVLDLRATTVGCSTAVLDSLNGMPNLTAFACGMSREARFTERLVSGAAVAGLVLACPALSVFQPVTAPAILRDAELLLVESLPPGRDITMIVEPGREPTTPRAGLRLVGDSAGLWDDLTDWHWPKFWD